MAFKVKRTFVDFGFGLQVKRGATPSRRVGGIFHSKYEAQSYATRHYPGQKTHIYGIRLESTPLEAPSSRANNEPK